MGEGALAPLGVLVSLVINTVTHREAVTPAGTSPHAVVDDDEASAVRQIAMNGFPLSNAEGYAFQACAFFIKTVSSLCVRNGLPRDST